MSTRFRLGPLYAQVARESLEIKVVGVRRTLRVLGDAIQSSVTSIEAAKATGDDEYLDFVVDDEAWLIDDLLGTAFVVSQLVVTDVVTHVMRLHRAGKELGVALSSTSGLKPGIIKSFSVPVATTVYSQVEVIDAFGNYFKHRDQWDASRKKRTAQNTETISIITAVGAEPFSTGNFRTAAEKLGNAGFQNLDVFADILESWAHAVYDEYDAELQQKGLR